MIYMSVSLDKIHMKIQRDKITKEVIKQAKKSFVPKAKICMTAAAVLTLHDKFGFGAKRLNQFIQELNKQYDSVDENYLDYQDIKKTIFDELKIDVDKML